MKLWQITMLSPSDRRYQTARVRKARIWYRRRAAVERLVDRTFIYFLFGYTLPHNSKWILFAGMFWNDCPICFWYRGVTFGFLLGGFLAWTSFYLLN